MSARINSNPPADLIPTHGTFSGNIIGATSITTATILMAVLTMEMQKTAAVWSIALSNQEAAIQKQMNERKEALWERYGMDVIEAQIRAGKPPLDDTQTQTISLYNSELSQAQASIQAAVKQVDPTLTTVQAIPQATNTSLNEVLQECGTVVQGQISVSNLRIQ